MDARRHPFRRALAPAVATIGLAAALASPALAAPAAIRAPLPHNAPSYTEAQLNAVACTSTGNCVAVGRYEAAIHSSYETFALVVTETNGHWGHPTAIASPSQALVHAFATLNAVACPQVGDCVAVGQFEVSQNDTAKPFTVVNRAMYVVEKNGVWGAGVQSPEPPDQINGEATTLNGVSCPALNQCLAVGQYAGKVNNEAFTVLDVKGKWKGARTVVLKPYAKPNFITQLDGVSCTSVGNCIAVGQFVNKEPSRQALVVQEEGGVWGIGHGVPLPSTIRNIWAGLFSVQCPKWGYCEAVGVVSSGSKPGQGLIESEVKGTWERGILVARPSGYTAKANGAQLKSIACTAFGTCTAVGLLTDGQSQLPITLSQSKGWGRATIAPQPSGAVSPAYAELYGVACPTSSTCVKVGQYAAPLGDPAFIIS